MPRMARIVIPDLAHHVTRPGHRRQDLSGPARAVARKAPTMVRAQAETRVACPRVAFKGEL